MPYDREALKATTALENNKLSKAQRLLNHSKTYNPLNTKKQAHFFKRKSGLSRRAVYIIIYNHFKTKSILCHDRYNFDATLYIIWITLLY